MKAFNDYREAYNHAASQATKLGIQCGIGKCQLTKQCTVQLVPNIPAGYESRLELVRPGDPSLDWDYVLGNSQKEALQ